MLFCTLTFCLSPLQAVELNESFSHSLGIGSSAKSYEHKIELPPELAAQGKYFVARDLSLDGKLVIEKEELTKTWYYVKVRLPKATLWFAKGSIEINLRAEKNVAPVLTPASPTDLTLHGGSRLGFSWEGEGYYSAISLLNRSSGETLWERVILNDHECNLDEGDVKVGDKYLWAVRLSSSAGKYSPETQAKFRVEYKQEPCRHCRATGYVTCTRCHGSGHIVVNGPNDTPVTQICHTCNGTGRERCNFCFGKGYTNVPTVIPEN
jgi:hypothetical protein